MKATDIFTCMKCGECCKGYGGTCVSEKDIEAIAAYIHVDTAHFIVDYCHPSGIGWVLTQSKNGYCIFWDGLCTIHPVKPKMCRQWPFIRSVLVDPHNWHIMASVCPGIRTDIPDSVIRQCVVHVLATTSVDPETPAE